MYLYISVNLILKIAPVDSEERSVQVQSYYACELQIQSSSKNDRMLQILTFFILILLFKFDKNRFMFAWQTF